MRQTLTAGDRYLADKVATASPAELVGMLFDAGVQAVRQAVAANAAGSHAEAGRRLLKAQDVVMELRCSLNFDAGGELARNLDGLYAYVFRRLVEANVRRDGAAMAEALAILEPLRDAWREACLGGAGAGTAAGEPVAAAAS
jgi:flagellar protein FliS